MSAASWWYNAARVLQVHAPKALYLTQNFSSKNGWLQQNCHSSARVKPCFQALQLLSWYASGWMFFTLSIMLPLAVTRNNYAGHVSPLVFQLSTEVKSDYKLREIHIITYSNG